MLSYPKVKSNYQKCITGNWFKYATCIIALIIILAGMLGLLSVASTVVLVTTEVLIGLTLICFCIRGVPDEYLVHFPRFKLW